MWKNEKSNKTPPVVFVVTVGPIWIYIFTHLCYGFDCTAILVQLNLNSNVYSKQLNTVE